MLIDGIKQCQQTAVRTTVTHNIVGYLTRMPHCANRVNRA